MIDCHLSTGAVDGARACKRCHVYNGSHVYMPLQIYIHIYIYKYTHVQLHAYHDAGREITTSTIHVEKKRMQMDLSKAKDEEQIRKALKGEAESSSKIQQLAIKDENPEVAALKKSAASLKSTYPTHTPTP